MAIRKFLDISTAHLSLAAIEYLNRPARTGSFHVPGEPGLFSDPNSDHRWFSGGGESLVVMPFMEGWFCYAHDDICGVDADDVPAELVAIFTYARSRGCDWVMFDRDADLVNNLPIFEEV